MRIDEPGTDILDSANPADVAEQQAELDDSGLDDSGLDDSGFDDGPTSDRDLPLEANPADVAEQDAAVPYDDDER
jgi:hypothetical protein